jgi:pyruvate,water dikinase
MVAPGEILVCRTTTPAWTALFGVVGAVVTDTGGILSHAATVAREYAIPCVVGTRIATARFRDGDHLVVDGSEGTVLAHG